MGTIYGNKIHDLSSNRIAKANGLRKNFARDFSKKNMLVCVCFFSKPFCEMGKTKKHENNLSKIGNTSANHQNIPGAVKMCHDH